MSRLVFCSKDLSRISLPLRKLKRVVFFPNKMKFYHFSVGVMKYVGHKRGGAH